MRILALKIDVDSVKGYKEGLPALLELFDEIGLKASIFFGMGTDAKGGMFSKLLGAPKEIVASAPGILRDASRRGHDCGVHAWNPLEWKLRLDDLKDTTLESGIRKAVALCTQRTGYKPRGFSAPGWRASYMSLRIEDELNFVYCTDTFGVCPFYPRLSWKTFKTPQIPTTLPPIEFALRGVDQSEALARMVDLAGGLPSGLSVAALNAESEGGVNYAPLREFLFRCLDSGVKMLDLHSIAKRLDFDSLPVCDVEMRAANGFSSPVATQSFR